MGNRQVIPRSYRRFAYLGVRLVLAFAASGRLITFIGRNGGGGHKCPAGAGPSACSYPYGPWHWVEGILVGSLVGFLVFVGWLAVQRSRGS